MQFSCLWLPQDRKREDSSCTTVMNNCDFPLVRTFCKFSTMEPLERWCKHSQWPPAGREWSKVVSASHVRPRGHEGGDRLELCGRRLPARRWRPRHVALWSRRWTLSFGRPRHARMTRRCTSWTWYCRTWPRTWWYTLLLRRLSGTEFSSSLK